MDLPAPEMRAALFPPDPRETGAGARVNARPCKPASWRAHPPRCADTSPLPPTRRPECTRFSWLPGRSLTLLASAKSRPAGYRAGCGGENEPSWWSCTAFLLGARHVRAGGSREKLPTCAFLGLYLTMVKELEGEKWAFLPSKTLQHTTKRNADADAALRCLIKNGRAEMN